jgi:hypothetical protein
MSETALIQLRDKYGINVRYGRWLVKGYPRVFLIDVESVRRLCVASCVSRREFFFLKRQKNLLPF